MGVLNRARRRGARATGVLPGIETCSEIKCGEPRKSASLASGGEAGSLDHGEGRLRRRAGGRIVLAARKWMIGVGRSGGGGSFWGASTASYFLPTPGAPPGSVKQGRQVHHRCWLQRWRPFVGAFAACAWIRPGALFEASLGGVPNRSGVGYQNCDVCHVFIHRSTVHIVEYYCSNAKRIIRTRWLPWALWASCHVSQRRPGGHLTC